MRILILLFIIAGYLGLPKTLRPLIPITTTSSEARTHYEKSREFQNRYRLDSAHIELDKALKLDSTFALGYMLKGMISEDFAQRRTFIKKAMQYAPNASEGEQLWIKARNYYYGTQEGDSTELEYLKKLVQLYPNDPQANYQFGFVNHHHGNANPHTAITYLENAIRLDPDFTLAIDDLVYAYLEVEKFEEAENMAKRNVLLLPDLAQPQTTYAEILMRAGKHEASIEAYKNAIELEPTNAWSIIGTAANLNYLNKHQEAREHLDRLEAIEDISDYDFRHKWKARVVSFLDEGNIEAALEVLEAQKQLGLTKSTSHEPLFHTYMSFLRRIDLFYEMGDHNRGWVEYEAWRTFVTENLTREATVSNTQQLSNYYKSYEHYLKEEYSQALEYLELFKAAKGEETTASKRLQAMIISKQGNFEEAIEILESADQSNFYVRYILSQLWRAQGEDKKAENYEQVIRSTYLIDEIELAYVRSQLRAGQ